MEAQYPTQYDLETARYMLKWALSNYDRHKATRVDTLKRLVSDFETNQVYVSSAGPNPVTREALALTDLVNQKVYNLQLMRLTEAAMEVDQAQQHLDALEAQRAAAPEDELAAQDAAEVAERENEKATARAKAAASNVEARAALEKAQALLQEALDDPLPIGRKVTSRRKRVADLERRVRDTAWAVKEPAPGTEPAPYWFVQAGDAVRDPGAVS